MQILSRIFPVILCLFLLAGCTEAELAAHVAKQVPLPGESKSEGRFKVGSPYKVAGRWYEPEESYTHTETGLASWYGPGFHGKKTANGEIFDMYELTAAHKTLQLPSLVRVTNLENGRSLVVRVNDRGPFKRGRVIDLSKRAAELLEFKNQGVAKVKLEVLGDESRAIAMAARQGKDTRGYEVAMNKTGVVQDEGLPRTARAPDIQQSKEEYQEAAFRNTKAVTLEPEHIEGHIEGGRFMPDPVVEQRRIERASMFVQVGSFADRANALKLATKLADIGNADVYPASIRGRLFHRVRVGPIASVDHADRLLARTVSAGYKNAIIVVD